MTDPIPDSERPVEYDHDERPDPREGQDFDWPDSPEAA